MALKKIWVAMGGTVAAVAVAVIGSLGALDCGALTRTNEWQDVPPQTLIGTVLDLGGNIDTNGVKAVIDAEVGGTNTLVHTAQMDAATNAVPRIVMGANEIRADRTVKINDVLTDQWNPSEFITNNNKISGIRFVDEQWMCSMFYRYEGEWVFDFEVAMDGDYTNANATVLTFPSSNNTETHRVLGTRTTMIATTNDVVDVFEMATNNIVKLTSKIDEATNAVPRIVTGLDEIRADRTVKIDTGEYTKWNPDHCFISSTHLETNICFLGEWYCDVYEKENGEWVYKWQTVMGGDNANINSTNLLFTEGAKTYRAPVTRTTRLATTNDVGAAVAESVSTNNAAFCAAVTNVAANAQAATNAAEAVVADVLDYALTNLTGSAVSLASGQIGNVTLDAEATNLTVDLDFSAATDRSGDALLYIVNATNVVMSVGPSSVTTVGWDGSALNAGTNLVMFTRLKVEGETSLVMVNTKEVK